MGDTPKPWWRNTPLHWAWDDVIAPAILAVVHALPPLERFLNRVIDALARLLDRRP